jgi:raffinose/stachyose/melibiose transport system permease protein
MAKKVKSLKIKNKHIGIHIVLAVACIAILIPLYYVFVNAFKQDLYINLKPMEFMPKYFTLDNISNAWHSLKYPLALRNSAILVVLSCGLMILFGSLAGYSIAIIGNRFLRTFYTILIMLISVPFQVVMIPLVQILSALHLLNSFLGTSLVFVSLALPFTIFLYTGFMRSLPRELCQAAIVDGCGMGKTYLYIYMPLMKMVTGTILIIRGTSVWNDLLVPLITFSNEKYDPLIRKLYAYCSLKFNRWDLLFAGTLLCSIPILILFLSLQKVFIRGIMLGSVKG